VVDWHVCYVVPGGLRTYRIAMVKDHLKRVQVDDETPAACGLNRGVTVIVSELDREFRSLRDPAVTDELAQIFALYLRQYPTVQIYYAGTLIEPGAVEDHTQQYTLPDIATTDGEAFTASLEIVEWRMPTERRMFFATAAASRSTTRSLVSGRLVSTSQPI
jgi:hypothetical protein